MLAIFMDKRIFVVVLKEAIMDYEMTMSLATAKLVRKALAKVKVCDQSFTSQEIRVIRSVIMALDDGIENGVASAYLNARRVE